MSYVVWAVGVKEGKICASGNIFRAETEEEKKKLGEFFTEDNKPPKNIYSRMIRSGSATIKNVVHKIESGDYPAFMESGIREFLKKHDADMNFFFSNNSP